MTKLIQWLKSHEVLYRALRTFFQAAIGVVVSFLYKYFIGGISTQWDIILILAVATGAAALMNISGENNKVSNALSTLGGAFQNLGSLSYKDLLNLAQTLGVLIKDENTKETLLIKIQEALKAGETIEDTITSEATKTE